MFGFVFGDALDTEKVKRIAKESKFSFATESCNGMGEMQMHGDWISRWMDFIISEVQSVTKKSWNVRWPNSEVEVSERVFNQISDQSLRIRLSHFTAVCYERWKKEHVVLPTLERIKEYYERKVCKNCALFNTQDHTGRIYSTCNKMCEPAIRAQREAVTAVYKCNHSVIKTLYTQFCADHGYDVMMAAPPPEFYFHGTKPPFESVPKALPTYRELLNIC